MTTSDAPEWDDDTRSLALALELYDDGCCTLCGQPSWICQATENQDSFIVPAPVRCHATTALHQAQARVTEETNPQHEALLWSVQLTEGAPAHG